MAEAGNVAIVNHPQPKPLRADVVQLVNDLGAAYRAARDAQAQYVEALKRFGETRAEAFQTARTKAVIRINVTSALLKAALLAEEP